MSGGPVLIMYSLITAASDEGHSTPSSPACGWGIEGLAHYLVCIYFINRFVSELLGLLKCENEAIGGQVCLPVCDANAH